MSVTDEIRRALLGEFRQTARERLDRIGAAWVALENEAAARKNHAALMLRELHTLKGEAKLMGFSMASQLAHHLEELIVTLERRRFRRAEEVGDLVLLAVDTLGDAVAHDSEPPTGFGDLERMLIAACRGDEPPEAANQPAAPLPLAGSPEPVGRDAFVRVDIAVAQHLAEEASETVVIQARYRHAVSELRECVELLASSLRAAGPLGRIPAVDQIVERLAATVERLGNDLYDGEATVRALELDARTLRLTPLGPLFRSQIRGVRELARELGKQAALHIDDAGISMDRQVVERLGPPLLHLLRNSIDHGLEAPAARRRAGKPETGRITLAAERIAGNVIVAVEDDGAGIDTAEIRARALEVGLIASNESLDERDLLALLFSPGFSTRRRATETSGRGVGLDVVKSQIESLGGSVRISTRRALGTRFELRVPIDIALTRALIVIGGGQPFAIPHVAVDAVIAVDPGAIETIHTRRRLQHRGEWIPVVSLAAALGIPEAEVTSSDRRAIVLHHEAHCVAFVVESWNGGTDVVVKPLGDVAQSRVVIGACTIDGGDVALVLSPSELVARALGDAPVVGVATSASKVQIAQRILLVEDSAITRAMIAQLLRMLGYQVTEAENGARALRALEELAADAVLTDVEMPELDGIELIRRLRADPRWRRLPVVVLSTRGTDEDKQRASSAGADAYLVKTEFSETALRDVIARHLGKG